LIVKDPLKNIQLKNGLKTENANRVTDSIRGPNGYAAKSFNRMEDYGSSTLSDS
jgi:hypothetical protein